MSDSRIEAVEARLEELAAENKQLREALEQHEPFMRHAATSIDNMDQRLTAVEGQVKEDSEQIAKCLTGVRKLAEKRVEELKDELTSYGDSDSKN